MLRKEDGECLMVYGGRDKTLRAEMSGARNSVAKDTAVMHVLAGLERSYKTNSIVLLAAWVDIKWDNLLHSRLPVETDARDATKIGGEPSAAYTAFRTPRGSDRQFGTRAAPSRGDSSGANKSIPCWY